MTGCTEHLALSRRGFLTTSLLAAGVTAVHGTTVMQASASGAPSAAGTVVLLSLRGAVDGMSLVVPHGDPTYYAARPRIGVPASALVARDGFFGLHPGLSALLPWWRNGSMAAVHAAGLPAPNRSHFSAMEELEDADPGSAARIGWVNRLVGRHSDSHGLRAVQLAQPVPTTAVYGPHPTVAANRLAEIDVKSATGSRVPGGRQRGLRTSFAGSSPLARGMRNALDVVADAAPARTAAGPLHGARYPKSDLGRALEDAAKVIRGDVGAEVVTVDHGDWDHHSDLGDLARGEMQRMTRDLGDSIAAFFTDLGDLAGRVTLVTVSEFGRRVKENDSWGLDHGFGNAMLLIGAGVRGGYHGRWPGLQDTVDADLLVTTDYRSVLSEVVTKRLGASSATVFPGFSPVAVGAMA